MQYTTHGRPRISSPYVSVCACWKGKEPDERTKGSRSVSDRGRPRSDRAMQLCGVVLWSAATLTSKEGGFWPVQTLLFRSEFGTCQQGAGQGESSEYCPRTVVLVFLTTSRPAQSHRPQVVSTYRKLWVGERVDFFRTGFNTTSGTNVVMVICGNGCSGAGVEGL